MDPIDKQLQDEFSAAPDITVEAYAKQLGIAPPEEPETLKITEEELMPPAPAPAPEAGSEAANLDVPFAGTEAAVVGAAKGVGKGLIDLAQAGLNGIMAVGDGLENVAASYGFGSGDLIENSDYINWSEKLPTSEDNTTERVVRTITKYAAPIGGLAKLGVTGVRGLAANAGIDFALLDPKQERLADIVLNEAPELKNVVVLGNMLDALSSKEGDTQVTGRIKNMVEGLLVAGGVVAGAKGIAQAFEGAMTVSNKAKQIINSRKAVQQADNVVPPVAAAANNVPAPQAVTETTETVGEQLSFFDDVPTYKAADGATKVNPHSPTVLDLLAEYSKAVPESDILRAPKSGDVLAEEVKDFLADETKVKSLLSWKNADRPLSDVEVKAVQVMGFQAADRADELMMKINAGLGTADDNAQLVALLDGFKYVQTVKEGTGSAAGAALNAHKLSDNIGDMKLSQYKDVLNQKQKEEVLRDFMKFSGGEQSVEKLSKAYAALKQAGGEPLEALKKHAAKGNLQKAADAMQFVAINGMLSSPKTTIANMAANITTAVNSVATNTTAALIGRIANSSDRLTAEEGIAYVRGMWTSMGEGVTAAGQAMKGKPGGPADVLKVDFPRESPISMRVADDAATPLKVVGTIVNGTGMAVGLPTRINASADAFMGTVQYRGELTRIATLEANKKGLSGVAKDSFIKSMLADPEVKFHEQAVQFAKGQTFSEAMDPKNWLGSTSQKAQGLVDKIPMGKALFPFMNTTSNIIKYTIEHSPVGTLNFVSPLTRSVIKRGGRDADVAMAKIANGTMFMGFATWLASEGIVTGPEPANFKVAQALQNNRNGWQPNSILIGDTYHKLERLDPIVSYLKLGALMSNASSYIEQDEYAELATLLGAGVADFLTPELMVSTVGDFFQMWNEAGKLGSGTAVANFLADSAARFAPFSAALRDVRNFENELRSNTRVSTEGKNAFEIMFDKISARYQSQVPFLNRNLPVQRNMFGEPVYTPTSVGPDLLMPFQSLSADEPELEKQLRVLSQYNETNAPIDKDLNALGLSLPPRTLTFGGGIKIEMTPEEYERFQMLAGGLDPETGKPRGQSLRQSLEPLVDTVFKAASDGVLTKLAYNKVVGEITREITRFRKAAQSEMMMDPAINKRFQDRVKVMNEKAAISPQNLGM